MAELPYQTYERTTGKKWTSGAAPEVVELLKKHNITAAPGTREANLALQKALLGPSATQQAPVSPTASGASPGAIPGLPAQTPAPAATQIPTAGTVGPQPADEPVGMTATGEQVPETTQTFDIFGEEEASPDQKASSFLKERYGIDASAFDFLSQPQKSLRQVTDEIMSQTGLTEIRSRIQGITKEIEGLENERNQKVSEVNENPWLNESQRQGKVSKLQEQYEQKINARVNRLRLEEGLLQDAREETRFAAQAALETVQARQKLQSDVFQRLMDQAEEESKARRELALAGEPLEEVQVGGSRIVRGTRSGKVYSTKDIQGPPSVSEQYGTGIIGEYNFYAEQERAAGRRPLSFNEYQTQDANRKALASRAADASGLTPSQTQNFLRITDKFQADKVMENGNRGANAIAIADQVIADPKRAGNQLKVLYTLVKSLDPDSAVREGELDLAAQTQSFLERQKTKLDRLAKGQLLGPEAAKELALATKDLAQSWFNAAQRRERQYASQAQVAGVGQAFQDYLGGFERPYQTEGRQETISGLPPGEYADQINPVRGSVPDRQIVDRVAERDARYASVIPEWRAAGMSDSDILDYLSGQGFDQDLSRSENGSVPVAFLNSLVSQESGGNYRAVGLSTPYGKALGKYQIMPFHLSKVGLKDTPADRQKFLDSPALQDKLFSIIIGDLAKTYKGDLRKVAAAYYGGAGGAKVVGTPAGDRPQMAGGKPMPSINQYVRSVLGRLG